MRKLPFEYEAVRKNGEKCVMTIRRATPADLDEVMCLQNYVFAGVPSGDFALTTEDEIRESLREDFCAVAVDNGTIVAFTLLVLGRDSYRNYGTMLGYTKEQLAKSVSFDTSFVSPDHRGYGLQKLFYVLREEYAADCGAEKGFATVAPTNTVSLRNSEQRGFRELTRKKIYGGLDRIILVKDLEKQE
ncbi:MAG: GNAT family N-acetyltransferase [Anaerovoracaceae bacterium]|nr:GNAT family N-acetyltransferase [Anaerovoracaceae bacterium]